MHARRRYSGSPWKRLMQVGHASITVLQTSEVCIPLGIQHPDDLGAPAVKPNPTPGERRALAERIDLTEQQVQVWIDCR